MGDFLGVAAAAGPFFFVSAWVLMPSRHRGQRRRADSFPVRAPRGGVVVITDGSSSGNAMVMSAAVAVFLQAVGVLVVLTATVVRWADSHPPDLLSAAERIAGRLPGQWFAGPGRGHFALIRPRLRPASVLGLSLILGLLVIASAAAIVGYIATTRLPHRQGCRPDPSEKQCALAKVPVSRGHLSLAGPDCGGSIVLV